MRLAPSAGRYNGWYIHALFHYRNRHGATCPHLLWSTTRPPPDLRYCSIDRYSTAHSAPLKKSGFLLIERVFSSRCHQRRWSRGDRKSTRLNSSHVAISYAVFCLKNTTTPTISWHSHRHPHCY